MKNLSRNYTDSSMLMKKGTLMRKFIPIILLISIFLNHANEGSVIKIGVAGPFTGSSSNLGISLKNGVRIAVDEINAEGGLLGSHIQLIERDDAANRVQSIDIAHEMVEKEKVIACIGYCNSALVLESSQIYQQARKPLIIAAATGKIITRLFSDAPENYIFRVVAEDGLQSRMIINEVVDKRKLKRAAIFSDTTNYGKLGHQELIKALKNKGLQPTIERKFNVGDKNMSSQLASAKSAGAEVILTYGMGTELSYLAKQLNDMEWNVPIIGSWTLSMSSFIENAEDSGEGACMPQTFIQAPSNKKRGLFIDNYLAKFQPKARRIESPAAAAQGYDAMKLLAAAIKQAGSDDGSKIVAALEKLDTIVEGVIADYDKPFNKNNHDAIKDDYVIMGVYQNGRVTYAYREDAQQSVKNL
jgi:branched-chain amino acid transport system substrate-binding protein